MSDGKFSPDSIDAALATIIANQAAMDKKVDGNHTAILKRLDDGAVKFKEAEDRIGALERWKYFVVGVVAAIQCAIEYVIHKSEINLLTKS